jgi:hypothetical protein
MEIFISYIYQHRSYIENFVHGVCYARVHQDMKLHATAIDMLSLFGTLGFFKTKVLVPVKQYFSFLLSEF